MDSLRDIPATDVQADECWNLIYCKEKNKGPEQADNDEIGDCYNWVAIDRPTKLVLAFVCGRRTGENAMELARKVRRASSPAVRFQLTTNGLQSYIAAVDGPMRLRPTGEDLRTVRRERAALFPGRMHGSRSGGYQREPRRSEDLHQPRRAAKPHDADADSPVNAPDERVQQKTGESPSRRRTSFRVVQLLPDSRLPEGHPGDGSGDCRPRVEREGASIRQLVPWF